MTSTINLSALSFSSRLADSVFEPPATMNRCTKTFSSPLRGENGEKISELSRSEIWVHLFAGLEGVERCNVGT